MATRRKMAARILVAFAGLAGALEAPLLRLETPKGPVLMPQLALGTWRLRGEAATSSIALGIKAGFRHFDSESCCGSSTRARGFRGPSAETRQHARALAHTTCVADGTASPLPCSRVPAAAYNYKNHVEVGAAIVAHANRSSIFVTTKVVGCKRRTAKSCAAQTAADIELSLAQLRFSYVDLLLLHFPPTPFPWSARDGCARMRAQWRALQRAFEAGKARVIGVSNFCPSCIECLFAPSAAAFVAKGGAGETPWRRGAATTAREEADPPAYIVPAVNQVQVHVGMGVDPGGVVSYCAGRGIAVQAYSPLAEAARGAGIAQGQPHELITGELVSGIGRQHGRTGAQISLKYLTQLGIGVVTKSTSRSHLEASLDLSGWQLSPEEMRALADAMSPSANYSIACTR
jgi:diketogulonate reductase-like aldo/keto reductase